MLFHLGVVKGAGTGTIEFIVFVKLVLRIGAKFSQAKIFQDFRARVITIIHNPANVTLCNSNLISELPLCTVSTLIA
jgi:hypothetical protein